MLHNRMIALGLSIACISTIGISSSLAYPDSIPSDQDPRPFYLQHDWLPLSVPDPNYAPGALLSLTDDDGVAYVTSLSACNIDAPVSPLPPADYSLDFGGSLQYSPRSLLSLVGISPGPGFGKISSVSLQQQKHGAFALDPVKLRRLITDPQTRVSASCKAILNRSDIYIVEQSYAVTSGKFVLRDQVGSVLNLRTLSPPPLRIIPGEHLRVSSDGGLEFDDQLLFAAIRHLTKVRREGQTLGSSPNSAVPADRRVRPAMQASQDVVLEPAAVYNAVFSPTLPNSKTDLIDSTPSFAAFFIGPPNLHNALDEKSWTVIPQLLQDKSTVPLMVRMTCTFCKEGVQRLPLTYFGAKGSSTAATFSFVPLKSKIKDTMGNAQIGFQVTKNDIQLDYIAVKVRVNPSSTTTPMASITQPDPPTAVSRLPAWAREIDLIMSVRAGQGGRLEVSLEPGTAELRAQFGGKEYSPDGSVRWFKTGVYANQIPKLDGDLYLQLYATITNNGPLKLILSGSAAGSDKAVSSQLLNDTDQKALVALLATNGGKWYKKFFSQGAEADLASIMEKVRLYDRADRPVRVRIESQAIYMPWQLFIPPTNSEPKAEDFWGFRYELSVDPTGIDIPSKYLGPFVLQGGTGQIMFGRYRSGDPDDDVAALGAEELKYLQTTLGLTGISPANSRNAFKDGLSNNREDVQLILTFTHGANGTNIDSGGQLHQDGEGAKLFFALNEYLPVSIIDDLISTTPADERSFFPSGPLIFLNGCETGTAGFYATTNQDFAGTFLSMGARAVIVTEAPIWTYFGYSFGLSLLQELSKGEAVSDAMLKTRRLYLKNSHNPLGLLYSYYGGADVAIKF